MDINIPFEVSQPVCFTTPEKLFNHGHIEAIEVEVFIKVLDDATGEVKVLRPEAVFSKEMAITYVQGVLSQIQALA